MAPPLFVQLVSLSEESLLSAVHIAATRTERRILKDSALIPIYASGISFLLLVAFLISRIPFIKRLVARLRASDDDQPIGISRRDAQYTTITPATFKDELKEHIASHGGLTIYLHNTLRLVISLSLLGITIYAAIVAPGPQPQLS
ncbi:hypothetical protein FRB90_000932, partial [Tulasnella sp. 427]